MLSSTDFRHHLKVKSSISKNERAKQLYGPYTFDCALPVGWLDRASQILDKPAWNISESFVWLYLANEDGQPAPLTLEACDWLETIQSAH